MTTSNKAGQALAIVAASVAAATAVAMVIGAAPRRNPGRRRRSTVPDRADLIAALGLDPEGPHRSDRYAATTKEFWHKVQHGTYPAAVKARRTLGIEES